MTLVEDKNMPPEPDSPAVRPDSLRTDTLPKPPGHP